MKQSADMDWSDIERAIRRQLNPPCSIAHVVGHAAAQLQE
jgi:hypothetical protein